VAGLPTHAEGAGPVGIIWYRIVPGKKSALLKVSLIALPVLGDINPVMFALDAVAVQLNTVPATGLVNGTLMLLSSHTVIAGGKPVMLGIGSTVTLITTGVPWHPAGLIGVTVYTTLPGVLLLLKRVWNNKLPAPGDAPTTFASATTVHEPNVNCTSYVKVILMLLPLQICSANEDAVIVGLGFTVTTT
jgi:hypothetical protein